MLAQEAMWQMNKAHHCDLLAVAQQQRQLGQERRQCPHLKDRVFMALGDVLVTYGSRLKLMVEARYTPVRQ